MSELHSENKKKVILVDDDHQIRRILERALGDQFNLHCFTEASGVVRLLEDSKADFLIIDIILPGQSGLETILEIKALHPRIKIIAVSSSDSELLRAKIFHIDHTITKPLNQEKIKQLISYLSRDSDA